MAATAENYKKIRVMATKSKKNVKNDKENLQDSNIIATFAPGIRFLTPFTAPPIFEISSPQPTPYLVPNEALGLRDLFDRTQRGQRLGVHTRMRTDDCPDNMYRMEYEIDPKTGEPVPKRDPYEETLDHVPPSGINDIVDVQAYSEELAERKRELQAKRQRDIANARKSAPAPKPEGKGDKTPETKSEEGSEAK